MTPQRTGRRPISATVRWRGSRARARAGPVLARLDLRPCRSRRQLHHAIRPRTRRRGASGRARAWRQRPDPDDRLSRADRAGGARAAARPVRRQPRPARSPRVPRPLHELSSQGVPLLVVDQRRGARDRRKQQPESLRALGRGRVERVRRAGGADARELHDALARPAQHPLDRGVAPHLSAGRQARSRRARRRDQRATGAAGRAAADPARSAACARADAPWRAFVRGSSCSPRGSGRPGLRPSTRPARSISGCCSSPTARRSCDRAATSSARFSRTATSACTSARRSSRRRGSSSPASRRSPAVLTSFRPDGVRLHRHRRVSPCGGRRHTARSSTISSRSSCSG